MRYVYIYIICIQDSKKVYMCYAHEKISISLTLLWNCCSSFSDWDLSLWERNLSIIIYPDRILKSCLQSVFIWNREIIPLSSFLCLSFLQSKYFRRIRICRQNSLFHLFPEEKIEILPCVAFFFPSFRSLLLQLSVRCGGRSRLTVYLLQRMFWWYGAASNFALAR